MNLQNLIVCRNILDEEIFTGAGDDFDTAGKLVERAERTAVPSRSATDR